MSKRLPDSFVYFAKHPTQSLIKIGISRVPHRRVRSMQERPRLLGFTPEFSERHVHEKFQHRRIRGEWFHDCKEIRVFIRETRADNNLILNSKMQNQIKRSLERATR